MLFWIWDFFIKPEWAMLYITIFKIEFIWCCLVRHLLHNDYACTWPEKKWNCYTLFFSFNYSCTCIFHLTFHHSHSLTFQAFFGAFWQQEFGSLFVKINRYYANISLCFAIFFSAMFFFFLLISPRNCQQ